MILTEENLELWGWLFHAALFRISRGVFDLRVLDYDLIRKYSLCDVVEAARWEFRNLKTQAYCGMALDDIGAVIDDDDSNYMVVDANRIDDKIILRLRRSKTSVLLAAGPLSPLEKAEKRTIEQYLAFRRGVKNRVKNDLGITVNTLNAKIDAYGIDLSSFK